MTADKFCFFSSEGFVVIIENAKNICPPKGVDKFIFKDFIMYISRSSFILSKCLFTGGNFLNLMSQNSCNGLALKAVVHVSM